MNNNFITILGKPPALPGNLWDALQFISLYRQEGNPREQPLKNKWEYA
jgi:hypothetical protein